MEKLLSFFAMISLTGFFTYADMDLNLNTQSSDGRGQINELGFAILKDAASGNNANTVISPLSLRGVFLLLQQATSGNTLQQIDDAMGKADNFTGIYNDYTRHPNIKIVNLLAIDKSIPLQPEWNNNMPASRLERCDFVHHSPQEWQKLRSWAIDHTDGLITNMPSEGAITPDTRLVALNAVVFNGKWEYPFESGRTREVPFHAEKGAVNVDMMFVNFQAPVLLGPSESRVIRLPYRDTEAAMFVVLPRKGQKLADFLKTLQWKDFPRLFTLDKDIFHRSIDVWMPKFTIKEANTELSPLLQKHGVTDLFSAGKADFSRITTDKGLYCGSVVQQCYIEVDEEETKAVAVTAAEIIRGIEQPRKPELIRIDRPFLWFIYDQKHQLILFCGTYVGPGK